MENKTNTKRSSVKQIQSSMFISNLRKEMDKMASAYKKDDMVKSAHQYIKDGMTIEETNELLKIDGYDPLLVEAYIKNLSPEDFIEETIPHWGFDIEDSRGRIYSSSELNIIVTAHNRQDAWEKAEEEVNKLSNPSLDSAHKSTVWFYEWLLQNRPNVISYVRKHRKDEIKITPEYLEEIIKKLSQPPTKEELEIIFSKTLDPNLV